LVRALTVVRRETAAVRRPDRHTLNRVSDATEIPPELLQLRASIDNIDAALIHLLAERFKATQAVGVLKAERHMPPADPAREERQIARLREHAEASGLDPVFAEKFLNFVIAEVIHHHEQIAEATRP
jgi:chorismate mutase